MRKMNALWRIGVPCMLALDRRSGLWEGCQLALLNRRGLCRRLMALAALARSLSPSKAAADDDG